MTRNRVIGDYQTAVMVSNRIVAEAPDLSQPAKRRAVAPERMSLRWILVHMIEEPAGTPVMPTFSGNSSMVRSAGE